MSASEAFSSSNDSSANYRVAIATARFNRQVTDLMLSGCQQALADAGVESGNVTVVAVPGAWELPLACDQLARSGHFDAVIALGAVIRGETAHFDFISAECARGLQQVSLATRVPVAFGVLTAETGEQALERADPARKNKGREAAQAALDMITLVREIVDVG